MSDQQAAHTVGAASRQVTGRKRLPTRTSWKKGKSGNPAGRPAESQSWSGVIREVTDRNPDELAAMVGGKETGLGRALLQMPRGVPLKRLIAVRVAMAIMLEPSAGLLNTLINSESLADVEERLSRLETSRP